MNRWKIAVPAIGTPALNLAERMLNECLDAYWDEKADANLNGTIQCRIASGEGFSP